MRIALVGTRGVPARYGGFETAVEEVGRRLVARGHEVVVYCRTGRGRDPSREYLGMRLVHLPAAPQALAGDAEPHRAVRGPPARPPDRRGHRLQRRQRRRSLPLLRPRRIPVATHVDGLEWKRAKWGPVGRRYYRAAEALAVRWSDALIADARGIADYYRDEFGADTGCIAYGAPLIEPGSRPAGRARA